MAAKKDKQTIIDDITKRFRVTAREARDIVNAVGGSLGKGSGRQKSTKSAGKKLPPPPDRISINTPLNIKKTITGKKYVDELTGKKYKVAKVSPDKRTVWLKGGGGSGGGIWGMPENR